MEEPIPGQDGKELESRDQFLASIANAGRGFLTAQQTINDRWEYHKEVHGEGVEVSRAYNQDPEVKAAQETMDRSAVELTAGMDRLLLEADPAALSETVKDLVRRDDRGSVAGRVVQALPLIPQEITRPLLTEEFRRFAQATHESKQGQPRLPDFNVDILARLAAAHSVNTAPNPTVQPAGSVAPAP